MLIIFPFIKCIQADTYALHLWLSNLYKLPAESPSGLPGGVESLADVLERDAKAVDLKNSKFSNLVLAYMLTSARDADLAQAVFTRGVELLRNLESDHFRFVSSVDLFVGGMNDFKPTRSLHLLLIMDLIFQVATFLNVDTSLGSFQELGDVYRTFNRFSIRLIVPRAQQFYWAIRKYAEHIPAGSRERITGKTIDLEALLAMKNCLQRAGLPSRLQIGLKSAVATGITALLKEIVEVIGGINSKNDNEIVRFTLQIVFGVYIQTRSTPQTTIFPATHFHEFMRAVSKKAQSNPKFKKLHDLLLSLAQLAS